MVIRNKDVPLHCRSMTTMIGTVAQWINAPGYGPGDWGFESLRYHDESLSKSGQTLFYLVSVNRRMAIEGPFAVFMCKAGVFF